MRECWKENFRIFYESNNNMVNSRIETKCLNVNVPEKTMKNKVINTIRMFKNNKGCRCRLHKWRNIKNMWFVYGVTVNHLVCVKAAFVPAIRRMTSLQI